MVLKAGVSNVQSPSTGVSGSTYKPSDFHVNRLFAETKALNLLIPTFEILLKGIVKPNVIFLMRK